MGWSRAAHLATFNKMRSLGVKPSQQGNPHFYVPDICFGATSSKKKEKQTSEMNTASFTLKLSPAFPNTTGQRPRELVFVSQRPAPPQERLVPECSLPISLSQFMPTAGLDQPLPNWNGEGEGRSTCPGPCSTAMGILMMVPRTVS